MPKVIGIDLGTTYSGVAVFDMYPQMIPNKQGAVLIPSQVAFSKNQILVGDEARIQIPTNPKNSVYEVKRLMGKEFKDEAVQKDREIFPFEIVDIDKRATIKVQFNEKEELFSPEQISAIILKTLKQTSEEYLKEKVTDAVITVPAYFNNNQRAATKAAGEIAGLNVLKMINEPTAAALAYGYGQDDLNKTILVYDLGGGTFDVSIVKIRGRKFEVIATGGDTHLGGEEFTNRMVTQLLQEFENTRNITLNVTKTMRERLKRGCERAKLKLSKEFTTLIYVDSFYTKENGEREDYFTTFSRDTFESINQDLFKRTIDIVEKCLEDANLTKDQIDDISLVGGSTRIPKIREMLSEYFSPEKINTSLDPDEAVAMGAAIQAAILSGDKNETIQNTKLLDVIPLSLGVETCNKHIMCVVMKRNSLIPVKVTDVFRTTEDDLKSCRFSIYEGEREFTTDNIYLGQFTIHDLPPGPKGSVEFDVTFDIDIDGILAVTAVETQTKKKGEIRIERDMYRLSQEKINEIVQKAKENEQIDQANKSKALKKRDLEHYLNDVENILSLESTMENISFLAGMKCKTKKSDVVAFLENCENASEYDFAEQLKNLKSVCHPALNEIFKQTKGRSIGESVVILGRNSSAVDKPKTIYDVE